MLEWRHFQFKNHDFQELAKEIIPTTKGSNLHLGAPFTLTETISGTYGTEYLQ